MRRIVSAFVLSLSSLPFAVAQTRPAIEPGLLLHFGDGKGRVQDARATDETGQVSARLNGKFERTVIGPARAVAFNGVDNWIEIADDIANSKSHLPVREFTAAAWVNITEATKYGCIIGAAQDNGPAERGWWLGYSNDAFYVAVSSKGADDGDGKLTYLKGKTELKEGYWYHVVGTYDGQTMKIFVNGQLDGESREQSGEINYPEHAAFIIGTYMDDDEKFPMSGALVDVKLYDRALTTEQIAAAFKPGAPLAEYIPERDLVQRFVVPPYLQFATQTGMTIMAETNLPAKAFVEYGTRLPFEKQTPISAEATLHEIRIEGLNPQTPYLYRVNATGEDGTTLSSEILTFQTAVTPLNPYAFCIIGDTQKNPDVIAKLQQFAFSLRPSFEIHVGDVVDVGPDKREWVKEMLAGSNVLMSRAPLYPAIGNHEENHSLYYRYFSLPDPEYYYTYKYGNAQFFVLDTNKSVLPGSEQWQWLDSELAKSDATWKFVYHHHPVWSSDENDYGDTFKEPSVWGDMNVRPLAQLLERHNVDIDFNGHIHMYERSWPLREGKVDEARGVRYITSGGGGGGLESSAPSRAWFMQRFYRGHHICYLMIHDRTLQFQAFDLEGRLFDQFEIRKGGESSPLRVTDARRAGE